SSIRGTINGGGDFVYLQNQPNYIWMKENGAIKNYQLGSSIYLASSEFSSIRGTINGGGDFVKVILEKVIETPFTQITLIGTKAVVDLGFNSVTGVLVLEGQALVKELSTNTEKHVRAGEAVLIVPGHGISDASPVSNMNVTQWWKGSDLTVATPVSSHMRTLREQEPNEEEHEAMRIQPGDIVEGIFSIDRAITTRRGNDEDRYLVKLAPGINKITFTPLVAECNYWFYYAGHHLYPKGSEGPFSLIVEVTGQKVTNAYKEVGGKKENVSYGYWQELPIILATRPWSSDNSKGFQCVQKGNWYREIPYSLTVTGGEQTKPKPDISKVWPVTSQTRILREQEPNEEEHEAMRIQPGDIVEGAFSIDRGIATRRGNDMDRYLVKLAQGINKITFTPLVAECNYWLNYSGNHLYPKGSEGPLSLIVEVSGQKKTLFYAEVNGKREYKYGVGDDIYELPIILETRVWSNDSNKG
ncbi:MAG: hypothetical protein Q8K51_03815, partial [Nitrospirota bacterium]|nr:hypothetical protein [Nitrospirota bacterium]